MEEEQEIQEEDQEIQEEEQEADYRDISETENEDLLDEFNDDPKSFLANFARQVRSELAEEEMTQAEENAMIKTYEEYAQKNPDFDESWKRGEIQAFMQKHPGHNAISGHMALSKDKNQAQEVQTDVQSDKDLTQRITNRLRARRGR